MRKPSRSTLTTVSDIPSNACRCPHCMTDRFEEAKYKTRTYVYNIAWKGLHDELESEKAPAAALRQKLMAMVLAAGSHDLLDRTPVMITDPGYQKLKLGDKDLNPWTKATWSVFFKYRGAMLLLQKDIMAFLLSSKPTEMEVPFSLSLQIHNALRPTTDPSFIEHLRVRFQTAPTDLQKALETGIQVLENIGQPSKTAVAALRDYGDFIKHDRIPDERSTNSTKERRSVDGRTRRPQPLVVDAGRRQSLRSSSRSQSSSNTSPSSERHRNSHGPNCITSPYRYRPCSIGPSLANLPYNLRS